MAVCMVFAIPTGTQAQYDQIVAKTGTGLQPGQLFHAAGPAAGGALVVAVREGDEAGQAFFQGGVAEAVAALALPEGQPVAFPIHRMVRSGNGPGAPLPA